MGMGILRMGGWDLGAQRMRGGGGRKERGREGDGEGKGGKEGGMLRGEKCAISPISHLHSIFTQSPTHTFAKPIGWSLYFLATFPPQKENGRVGSGGAGGGKYCEGGMY